MPADLLISDPALTADAIAPAAHNDDLVAHREVGGRGYLGADLRYGPGNFMPRNRRKLHLKTFFEITIQKLDVRTAHTGRLDFYEDFIGTDSGRWNFLEYKRLVVAVNSCCTHSYPPKGLKVLALHSAGEDISIPLSHEPGIPVSLHQYCGSSFRAYLQFWRPR